MNFEQLPADQLVQVCASGGDSEAWREFLRRFHRLVSVTILRIARQWGFDSLDVVDDLVQETYAKLCADHCRNLKSFTPRYQDSSFAFLKVIAANVANDYFRSRGSQKRGKESAHLSLEEDGIAPASSNDGPDAIDRSVLIHEIQKELDVSVTGPTADRDRLVFWLYYRQGCTAAAIARIPEVGLSVKGVESTILRLTRLIRMRLVNGAIAGSRREGQPPQNAL